MKTKFGLLSIGSALIILVLACGYANAEISSRHAVPASLQLSIIYPSNGILTPGQSQVVQVAAAIQPSPGTPIHAYLLMLKVRGQNGNALFANCFNPTKANSLASLNMKQLSPGNYTVTAQLQYNGTSVAAPQKYQITESDREFCTPTPTGDCTCVTNLDPDLHVDANCDRDRDSDLNANRDCNLDPNFNVHANCDRYPDHFGVHSNCDRDVDLHANCDRDLNSDLNLHSNCDSDRVCHVTQTATAKATSTPTASPAPTPSGLCSVMPPQTQLVDSLAMLHIVRRRVDVNGVADGYSANVKQVVWDGTDIWQYNGSQWYYQSAPCPQCIPGQAGAWTLSAICRACSGPVPTATATATSAATVTATGAATRPRPRRRQRRRSKPDGDIDGCVRCCGCQFGAGDGQHSRIGVNMDIQSQYDGQAYLQNYLDNPGFEQAMLGHVLELRWSHLVRFYRFQ